MGGDFRTWLAGKTMVIKILFKKMLTPSGAFERFDTHTEQQQHINTMRTKTLLLSAALTAAGVCSSLAQVYSVNAVGYVNLVVAPGLSMIANPLSATDNTLGGVLTTATGTPFGTQIYQFNGTTFVAALYDDIDGWTHWHPVAAFSSGTTAQRHLQTRLLVK